MQPSVLDRLSGAVLSGADIRRELGAPAMVTRVGSFKGDVWSWRYEEMGIPRLFHAYIDPQGMVARTNSTDEPIRPSINM